MDDLKKEEFINSTEDCLRRILGECPHCKRDYNPNHRPNNLDCPRYVPYKVVRVGVRIG